MNNFLVFCVIILVVTISVATDDWKFYDNVLLVKRSGIGYTDFSPEEADAIVARHNYHRGNTKPEASNMREMKWNKELATKAQRWADTCDFKHESFSSRSTSQFSHVGQNIAMGNSQESSDGAKVTDLWHSEEENYNYEFGCAHGEICGHYTQIIWADTSAVGCGRKLCASLNSYGQTFRNFNYIVCNYGPAGNYYGEKPFKKGNSCSECPNDAAFCTGNNLCRKV